MTTQKDDQVKLLVALQDLDHMINEVNDETKSAKFKDMGFNLDGVAELQSARAKLAERITPQLLNRYERVSKNYDRTVVPVLNDLCLGCFAKVPTSFRSLHDRAHLLACENCGRLLYFT